MLAWVGGCSKAELALQRVVFGGAYGGDMGMRRAGVAAAIALLLCNDAAEYQGVQRMCCLVCVPCKQHRTAIGCWLCMRCTMG